MTYNDAALRRLRDGLLHYRSANRINGRKRKWERIAEDMLEAPTTSRAYRNDEADYPALGEALRRFAAGGQTLGTARLDVLRAFLESGSYILADDGEDSTLPPGLAQAIYRAFSGGSDPAPSKPDRIEGTFFAVRGEEKAISFLRIAQQPDGLLSLEESVYELSTKPSSRDPIALRRMARVASLKRVNRDGWVFGFKSTLVLARDRANNTCEHKIIAAKVGYELVGPGNENADRRVHTLIVVDSAKFGPKWTTTKASAPQESIDNRLKFAETLATTWAVERLWFYERYEEPLN